MTSALVQRAGTKTEMELDRGTRNGLLFLPGLSPTGWQNKWLMTGSMISGGVSLCAAGGGKVCEPEDRRRRDALPKHQGAPGGSLSRWFGVEQGDAPNRKDCPIPARRLSPRSDLEDEDTVRAWDVHVHPRIVSTRGPGRIVAARLGTLPFHKDKVQLMSGAAVVTRE